MFTDEEALPWVKEKIRKTTSHKIDDNGDLYGAMHCLCSDHRSMEVYIKAYKCDEKQGVIVNLHRGLSDAITSLECLKVDCTDLREHLKRAEQALGLDVIPEHLKLDMEKTLRLAKRLEAAEALLKRAYDGMHKEHWQEGESEQECCDAIETYFFNVAGSKPL